MENSGQNPCRMIRTQTLRQSQKSLFRSKPSLDSSNHNHHNDADVRESIARSERVTEALAGVFGTLPELLLNPQDLIVLGETFRAARGSGLDLAGGESDDQVGDESILGLAGSMRHHRPPAGSLGQLVCGNRLRHRADLVDFEQQAVARLALDGHRDALRVRHRQVIADDLDVGAGRQVRPRLPVVLVERILDRHDRELLDELQIQVRQFTRLQVSLRVRCGVLKVQIVLALPIHK